MHTKGSKRGYQSINTLLASHGFKVGDSRDHADCPGIQFGIYRGKKHVHDVHCNSWANVRHHVKDFLESHTKKKSIKRRSRKPSVKASKKSKKSKKTQKTKKAKPKTRLRDI